MEGLFREQETKQNQTSEERVRLISERLEGLASKIDDPHQGNLMMESLDSRLNQLERAVERATNTCLAVFHGCGIPKNSLTASTSISPSDATTVLASALEGEKWTSSPHSSAAPSSVEDEFECEEIEEEKVVLQNGAIHVSEDVANQTLTGKKQLERHHSAQSRRPVGLDFNIQDSSASAGATSRSSKKVVLKNTYKGINF